MNDRFFTEVSAGAVVLTATRRLSRSLTAAYDCWQLARAAEAWPSAEILPLRSWIERSWRATWPETQLLSPAQARALWEAVVREDTRRYGLELLQENAAADTAMEANELVSAYGLPDLPPSEATAEHQAFLRWREAFRTACHDQGWMDPAELTERVSDRVRSGDVKPPSRILLAGFDEIRPADARLFEVLRQLGCRLDSWEPDPPRAARCRRLACADPQAEIRLAASWIRRNWRPEVRVGLVIPDLDLGRREMIERVLTEELSPGAMLPGSPQSEIVNISLGPPLADEPVVATALTALEALSGLLRYDKACFLLQAEFFGEAQSEWRQRSRLEVDFRSWGAPSLRLESLSTRAEELDAPKTASRLRALAEASRRAAAQSLAPSRWARTFAELLEAAGWPGERTLDSREAQAIRAWHEALGELASLDRQLGLLGAREARARLERLCRDRVFQPESGDAPIQVLGLLETAGLGFDCLWIAGLHEDALPRPPRPNPLLPPALQRRYRLPRSSADIELDFARKLMRRLRSSAAEVVLSSPRMVEGQEVEPSPLVAAIGVEAPDWPTDSRALSFAVRGARDLETVRDEPPPPLGADEPKQGGTEILRDQSACPFRAFARHRLNAKPVERPAEDLTAKDWGRLVHRAMESLWAEIRLRANLDALDETALGDAVAGAAHAALGASGSSLRGRIRDLVQARLSFTLRRWLEIERRRPDFEVAAREHETEVELGGLVVRARLDRVDRLADGSRIIIDYKTGEARRSEWWGERPADPQLLIYSQVRDDTLPSVDAIALACIRPGEYGFRGLARSAGLVPGADPPESLREAKEGGLTDWDVLLDRWRQVLERLAADFVAGKAEVDPLPTPRGKWPPKTCDHCPLPPLCRVHDLRIDREDEP